MLLLQERESKVLSAEADLARHRADMLLLPLLLLLLHLPLLQERESKVLSAEADLARLSLLYWDL
jgi:hypothetical protein